MIVHRIRRMLNQTSLVAVLFATFVTFSTTRAYAQEIMIPVPKIVIYPGDIISDGMLMDVAAGQAQVAAGGFSDSRSAVVGKRAKRTLLPGRAILTVAVENPRTVVNGGQVSLIYNDGGLTIVTSATALQDGSTGDIVKVRNIDSGLTVSGIVQANGSVLVSGG